MSCCSAMPAAEPWNRWSESGQQGRAEKFSVPCPRQNRGAGEAKEADRGLPRISSGPLLCCFLATHTAVLAPRATYTGPVRNQFGPRENANGSSATRDFPCGPTYVVAGVGGDQLSAAHRGPPTDFPRVAPSF